MLTAFVMNLVTAGAIDGPRLPAPWSWNTDTPICAIKAQFQEATVELRQTPVNEGTEVKVTVPGRRLSEGEFDGTTVRTSSGREFKALARIGQNPKREPAIYLASLDREFLDALLRSASIELSHPKFRAISVAAPFSTDLLPLLRSCEDQKMRLWGVDPTWWRSLRRAPFPIGSHPMGLFSSSDYPADAADRGIQLEAIIRLDISAVGAITNCRMLNTRTLKSFETASCRVLRRARFQPAIDQNGNPISAPIIYNVVYRMSD